MRRFVAHNTYVPKPKVTIWSKMSYHVSAIVQKSTNAKFFKLCRKIRLNEKLCQTQNIGFHPQVPGQIQRTKVKLFVPIY